MRTTAKAALAAAGILSLCGHALSQEVRIPRKGSSPGIEKRQVAHRHVPRHAHLPRPGHLPGPSRGIDARRAAHCWEIADEASQAQERAKQNVLVGYLAGGLIGALIASSQNGEAYERDVWREVFDKCMARRRPTHNHDEDD